MTIVLVERYNNKKPGLIDFICSAKEEHISMSDEEIREIKNSLTVRSIEEAAKCFEPEVEITLEGEQISIPVCHPDGFFWKVIQIWETIRSGDYTDITEDSLADSLLMKDSITEAEFLREQEQIFFYLQKNQCQQAQDQLKRCMELLGDTLFLSKRLITRAGEYLQKGTLEHKRFVVESGREAALQCIAVSEAFRRSRYHTKQIEKQYEQLLEQMVQPQQRLFYWNMMLACSALSKEKKRQLNIFRKEIARDYEAAKKSFWRQAKPLIQTLINCYLHFSRPGAEELLITNCSIRELSDSRYRRELKRYLETVNRKQYVNDAIYNAILPNVRDKRKQKNLVRQRFPGEKREGDTYESGTLDEADTLKDVFNQYGIETKIFMYDEGKPFGYLLTGIDVLRQMPDDRSREGNKLRSLTIWLDELKVQEEG